MNNTYGLTEKEIADIVAAVAECPDADTAIAFGERQVAIMGMGLTEEALAAMSARTGLTLTLFEALSDAEAEKIFLGGEVIS